jgi:3-oxoacyl-[acyl-carrier-protein] synthase II
MRIVGRTCNPRRRMNERIFDFEEQRVATTGSINQSEPRVVVTGIGVVSPVGHDARSTWDALVDGKSGIAPITRFDPTGYQTTFAGEVKGFDPAARMGRKDVRRTDRYSHFAVASALEALEQAGLTIDDAVADRVGVLIGSGMGGAETLDAGMETVLTEGPNRLSPFFMPMFLGNMASGTVAIATGARGPNFAPVSACASSAHAIGEAAAIIRRGQADVVIAGGSEAPLARMVVAGFNAMGALSTRNDDPAAASRPFDAERDGFVLGEGGAALILESAEHAARRGATVLADLTGYGSTDDANHMVQPAPGGIGAARAMTLALEAAGLRPEDIDYINAHGTSTPLNEKFETQAIKAAFGDTAHRVPISSTKSMTGHLLGAAGALEAALAVMAIEHGVLPPTINQTSPDPDCDLDYVPNVARRATVKHVMSNSMGFGGHNVSLIFSAPRE